ncbi:MAG: polyphosphate polymerase domain-containing protein [Lachnospiraceae bacterium]
MNRYIFERTELKYLISPAQKDAFLNRISDYIEQDSHGESTVYSLYFDTPSYQLIRNSMEKPLYKEKLRLRSYGIPSNESKVFLELKKKYKGVVYKRREEMTLSQAEHWINTKEVPKNSQIMREIDYISQFYHPLQPKMLISCQRQAYFCVNDPELRFTFDQQLQYRTTDLSLTSGSYGEPIVPNDACVLEIKALFSMPLWLTEVIDELHIVPSGFSKYAMGYQKWIENQAHSSNFTWKSA